MFTGKVDTHEPVLKICSLKQGEFQIFIKRPGFLRKIRKGDSLALDGVCLTLESKTQKSLQFFVSQKTHLATQWNEKTLINKTINIESPLKLGDPLHGHLVTGHVDTTGIALKKKELGKSLVLSIEFPNKIKSQIFENASIAVNGVSLTIHKVYKNQFNVHLIPETLKKTNLGSLKKGDLVNLETDFLMKGFLKNNKPPKFIRIS